MAVDNKTATKEEKAQEQRETQEKEDRLADSLLETLDLPDDKKMEEASDNQGGKVDTKDSVKEVDEKLTEEEIDVGEAEDDTDEELIPASKLKRRLESEKIKQRELEARIKQLESQKPKQTNEQRAKLEAMSDTELKALKRTVRAEWKKEEDPQREQQLDALMDEIDDVIRSAPMQFQQKQFDALNRAVEKIKVDERFDSIDFDKDAQAIEKIGEKILQKHPTLKGIEEGLAIAMEQAVERFNNQLKTSEGKSRVKESDRKLTKLKQKTALDSSAIKGNQQKLSVKRLYERAKHPKAGFEEKAEFLENLVDVDRFLDSEQRRR